jgi:hypothetical protein
VFVPAIVRAFRPTPLQILCAVGFFHGISLFVYTIRQRRGRPALSHTFTDKEPLSRDSISTPGSPPHPSPVQAIPLSPSTDPVNVSAMTQQQKIAAALIKAGSSNSSWYDSELNCSQSKSPVQVAIATPTTADEGTARIHPQRDAPTPPGWKINLMFSVSAVLTILSLYFLLESLR